MKTSKRLSRNGSITIPKDMRLKLGWNTGMSLDISATPDGMLIVRKHHDTCRFCGTPLNLLRYKDLCICRNCADTMKGELS